MRCREVNDWPGTGHELFREFQPLHCERWRFHLGWHRSTEYGRTWEWKKHLPSELRRITGMALFRLHQASDRRRVEGRRGRGRRG